MNLKVTKEWLEKHQDEDEPGGVLAVSPEIHAEMNEYNPDKVSAPGETLKEWADDNNIGPFNLSNRLGVTIEELYGVLNGTKPITSELAAKLETVTQIPASFWETAQANYEKAARR